jgi:hypothetical protein
MICFAYFNQNDKIFSLILLYLMASFNSCLYSTAAGITLPRRSKEKEDTEPMLVESGITVEPASEIVGSEKISAEDGKQENADGNEVEVSADESDEEETVGADDGDNGENNEEDDDEDEHNLTIVEDDPQREGDAEVEAEEEEETAATNQQEEGEIGTGAAREYPRYQNNYQTTQQDIIRAVKKEHQRQPMPSSRIETDEEKKLRANMPPTNSILVDLDKMNLLTGKSGGKFKPSVSRPRVSDKPSDPVMNEAEQVVEEPATQQQQPKPKKGVRKTSKVAKNDERLELERNRKPTEPKTPSPSSNRYTEAVGGFGSPGTPGVEVDLEDEDARKERLANTVAQSSVNSSIAVALNSSSTQIEQQQPPSSSFLDMTELLEVINDLRTGSESDVVRTLADVAKVAIESQTKVTMAALDAQKRNTDMVSNVG